ncbi:hypothetical protein WS62_09185 [Burkholderia sp. ABCPW 14]|nr:hypothetical protein WS62_09185 [Burkholderia sp. ABCPW 14]
MSIVGAICTDGADGFFGRDLIEQFRQHFVVGDVLMRHQRRSELTGACVERQMYIVPGSALRVAVLTNLTFVCAVELRARAVDHKVQRRVVADDRQLRLQRLRATAQRRVVRYRQISEGQVPLALCETLKRSQRQAKHLLEPEQSLDDRIGIHAGRPRCCGTRSGALISSLCSIHIVTLPRMIRPAL